MSFKDRIREARLNKHLTQEQLSKKIGVAKNKIIDREGLKQCAVAQKANMNPREFNAMLNGRKIIKPCDIIAISSALGIKPGELFKELENSDQPERR